MTDYGVTSSGYVRKPLATILAELEAAMRTQFGAGVIQTAVSPLGQLNGLVADLLAEVDERNLDLYQSYDPDQAEGTRLDTLARLRMISRGSRTDVDMRQALTNAGRGRVDVQDLASALLGIDGVTYARVYVNDSGEMTPDLPMGYVCPVVMGGDDDDIAAVIRSYVVPGVSTFGNTLASSVVDGYCRSVSFTRPKEVVVSVIAKVSRYRSTDGCPAPSLADIKSTMLSAWETSRANGADVSFYSLRTLVERAYTNVELVTFSASRDGEAVDFGVTAEIGFMEIATLSLEVIDND